MAQHLDLEEQEQLAELKHFWSKYGNLISTVLIVVFGSIAAWNGWNWWQRSQAANASALYAQVELAVQTNDLERVQRSAADIQSQFARTTYAQQASLLAAQALQQAGRTDAARSALEWVADKASDPGYQAVARLRLAAILVDAKAHDDALRRLSGSMPAEFAPLAADLRGDIYKLQGKATEAVAEYQKALAGLPADAEYRRLVEVKLTSLGAEVPRS
ncbi:tetratricopeptide repeat protein [Ramlibacter sp. AN1015]|uniref:YfgM family protein n=1 Tax=Ramlibacter sp. AN1015 TaxID=3133428 RepID=UPI0030C4332E